MSDPPRLVFKSKRDASAESLTNPFSPKCGLVENEMLCRWFGVKEFFKDFSVNFFTIVLGDKISMLNPLSSSSSKPSNIACCGQVNI